jgi:hypothetical protein
MPGSRVGVMCSGWAVGNQVECRPVPVSLLHRLRGVGRAATVEDGVDGFDVGVVGRLGEFEPEQHRQVLKGTRGRHGTAIRGAHL